MGDDDEEADLAGATPQSALPTAPLQGSQGARYSVFNYSNAGAAVTACPLSRTFEMPPTVAQGAGAAVSKRSADLESRWKGGRASVMNYMSLAPPWAQALPQPPPAAGTYTKWIGRSRQHTVEAGGSWGRTS